MPPNNNKAPRKNNKKKKGRRRINNEAVDDTATESTLRPVPRCWHLIRASRKPERETMEPSTRSAIEFLIKKFNDSAGGDAIDGVARGVCDAGRVSGLQQRRHARLSRRLGRFLALARGNRVGDLRRGHRSTCSLRRSGWQRTNAEVILALEDDNGVKDGDQRLQTGFLPRDDINWTRDGTLCASLPSASRATVWMA